MLSAAQVAAAKRSKVAHGEDAHGQHGGWIIRLSAAQGASARRRAASGACWRTTRNAQRGRGRDAKSAFDATQELAQLARFTDGLGPKCGGPVLERRLIIGS